MKNKFTKSVLALELCALMGLAGNAYAEAYIQCPGDTAGNNPADAVVSVNNLGRTVPGTDYTYAEVKCMHLSGGDGFAKMADGNVLYTFGFGDLTGTPEADSIAKGILFANAPAPAIILEEGDKFFLTLTNTGMVMRPDLADPHTVHFHGFPNASSVFDGVPDATISINMGASLTYFYNIVQPGTYMYHCHVEAAEHMQMGMVGNLYVHSGQDGTVMADPDGSGRSHSKFVYDDGDGSTGYDQEFPMQMGSFDRVFHEAHIAVQPLRFANMEDTYTLLNGRGYPDTVVPGALPPPAEIGDYTGDYTKTVQNLPALVTATQGEKILLRLSNLNVSMTNTVMVNGLTMKIVGQGARLLRGPDGKNLYYDTNQVTLGGGESADAIIDTAGVTPGTYFLYTSNFNYLSNDDEDFGGMMTEIVINP